MTYIKNYILLSKIISTKNIRLWEANKKERAGDRVTTRFVFFWAYTLSTKNIHHRVDWIAAAQTKSLTKGIHAYKDHSIIYVTYTLYTYTSIYKPPYEYIFISIEYNSMYLTYISYSAFAAVVSIFLVYIVEKYSALEV